MRRGILTLLIAVVVVVAITLAEPNKKKQHQWKAQKSGGSKNAHNTSPHYTVSALPAAIPAASAPIRQSAARQPQPRQQQAAAGSSRPPQTVVQPLVLQAAAKRPPLQIVGGQDATLGEFPYQVSIRYAQFHLCGGTLVAPNYVLTAGLCVNQFIADELRIVAGTVNLSGLGGQTIYVTEIIVHPDLDAALLRNDIALLRLSTTVRCNEDVQIIELDGTEMLGGEAATAIGIGLTSYPDPITETDALQYADLTIISNAECLEKTPDSSKKYLYAGTLCTAGVVGRGTCFGDGGGPLVVAGKQVGVLSWMIPCAQGYPDVFMRITTFLEWILHILQSGDCGSG